MPETTRDLTTLICLFHHKDNAHAALEDILKAGVPEANVTLIGDEGSPIAATTASLHELNVPNKDLQHLLDGLNDGGAVLTVSAISSLADKVEAIFKDHRAGKIDEATIADDMSAQAIPSTTNPEYLAASDPQELPAEPYNTLEPEEFVTPVRVFRVVALPGSAFREGLATSEPLADDFSDVQEDVDPRELGLDSRMAPKP